MICTSCGADFRFSSRKQESYKGMVLCSECHRLMLLRGFCLPSTAKTTQRLACVADISGVLVGPVYLPSSVSSRLPTAGGYSEMRELITNWIESKK